MSFLSAVFRPFSNTFNYLRPIVFYALLVGFSGPIAVVTVPRVRASYGWKPAERIPITYPLPEGPRKSVSGYEDE
ncbi:n19m, NADH-ubiquinone oxidoreductase 9.5 kDa subunit [Malassezia obtusa]|uniref:N19m, NADH-ubiquinone oxidoreductase 9.5 kDa subunit n=1 Tax=Malassezia obtusa TaxID=76774 RepID=A0AAF0DZK3_9BASI|nr:n19m, NADH-ubiquinone oxidoreductase 9.5 kDa subunit [Malassezia obtusa]